MYSNYLYSRYSRSYWAGSCRWNAMSFASTDYSGRTRWSFILLARDSYIILSSKTIFTCQIEAAAARILLATLIPCAEWVKKCGVDQSASSGYHMEKSRRTAVFCVWSFDAFPWPSGASSPITPALHPLFFAISILLSSIDRLLSQYSSRFLQLDSRLN